VRGHIDVEPAGGVDVNPREPVGHVADQVLHLADDERRHRREQDGAEKEQGEQPEGRGDAAPPASVGEVVDRGLEREGQEQRDHEPHDEVAQAPYHGQGRRGREHQEDDGQDEARDPRRHLGPLRDGPGSLGRLGRRRGRRVHGGAPGGGLGH
jgi:hypothetical protein